MVCDARISRDGNRGEFGDARLDFSHESGDVARDPTKTVLFKNFTGNCTQKRDRGSRCHTLHVLIFLNKKKTDLNKKF